MQSIFSSRESQWEGTHKKDMEEGTYTKDMFIEETDNNLD